VHPGIIFGHVTHLEFFRYAPELHTHELLVELYVDVPLHWHVLFIIENVGELHLVQVY
jgi:hypothetical protein